jgi:hypothetical protein
MRRVWYEYNERDADEQRDGPAQQQQKALDTIEYFL